MSSSPCSPTISAISSLPLGARLDLLRLRARPDHRERDAEAAWRSLIRLSRLISDLLDVSRLDRGVMALDVQPAELSGIDIDATLATPDHAVTIDSKEDAVVLADAGRIRQCLENVVSNATRYSPPEAPVAVMIGKHENERGKWGGEVRDQAPASPPRSCRASSSASLLAPTHRPGARPLFGVAYCHRSRRRPQRRVCSRTVCALHVALAAESRALTLIHRCD
jgi:hypothetical protein